MTIVAWAAFGSLGRLRSCTATQLCAAATLLAAWARASRVSPRVVVIDVVDE